VDINARAVRCTRFNAGAAGLDNLEALQGDLYGPVEGRRFDLITANPPFVPAPAQEVGFRDGGPSGEDVQRRIVEGLARHLAPGGLAQMVTELGERDGESLEDRLRAWLGGAPMDIHVLRLRAHSAQAYATGHAEGDDYPAFLDSVASWAGNLRTQGYARVVSVLLTFRWSEAPWFRMDQAQPPLRDAGPELEVILEAERTAGLPEAGPPLDAATVQRAGPVFIQATRTLGAQVPPSLQARLAGRALPLDHALDPMEEDLLGCLDAPVTVASLLSVADRADMPREAVLEAVRSLLRKGLILRRD
jgi:hypothetical protein